MQAKPGASIILGPQFFCIGLSIAFVLLNSHALKIGLLPIDDHEIAIFSVNPIKSWLHSETFNPWSRWRPSYYTIRLLESFLWGNNALAWHLSRLIGLSIGIGLLAMAAISLMGQTMGMLFGMVLVFSPVLGNLAQILGPAETYCFLGISSWAYGYICLLINLSLIKDHTRETRIATTTTKHAYLLPSILVCLGSVIAAGSKENLAILALPNLWILYKTVTAKSELKPGRHPMLIIALSCILMIPIIFFLGNIYLTQGKDIYEKTLNPSGLEMVSYVAGSFHWSGLALICIATLTVFLSITLHRFSHKDIILSFLILMSLWSVYVNRQSVPYYIEQRYALLHQLALLGMFWMVASYWSRYFKRLGTKWSRFALGISCLIIIYSGAIISAKGYATSITLASYSRNWEKFLSSAAQVHSRKQLPIVIISSHWLNSYERSYSSARFLQSMYNIDPKSIFVSYIPDRESRTRIKDNFQTKLEFDITSKQILDGNLGFSSGGIVNHGSLNNLQLNTSQLRDKICVMPTESQEIIGLVRGICSELVYYKDP